MLNATFSVIFKHCIKNLISVLGATISHAEFLSGRSDETGDLMNKLALINVATMKLVKEEGEIHSHNVWQSLKKSHFTTLQAKGDIFGDFKALLVFEIVNYQELHFFLRISNLKVNF